MSIGTHFKAPVAADDFIELDGGDHGCQLETSCRTKDLKLSLQNKICMFRSFFLCFLLITVGTFLNL
jgi:hypothetical protein